MECKCFSNVYVIAFVMISDGCEVSYEIWFEGQAAQISSTN